MLIAAFPSSVSILILGKYSSGGETKSWLVIVIFDSLYALFEIGTSRIDCPFLTISIGLISSERLIGARIFQ